MGDEVSYDADARLMRVRVRGHETIGDMQTAQSEVMRLHEAHDTNALIVDTREQTSSAGLFDIFDFGEAWPPTIQVAILVGSKTPDDIMFMETVAIQRGKKMRIFYSETEALDWLREA